jgi:uncharacterized protein YecT (DUF1311 family)
MPTERSAEPWPEATYNGFSGPGAVAPRRRRWPWLLAIGGGAAIILGAGAGLLIRPDLGGRDGDVAAAGPAVPIEVNAPPPQAPPRSDGKLEVLPPGAAAAAAPPAYVPAPAPPLPSVETEAPPPRYPSLGPAPSPPTPEIRQAPPPAAPAPGPAYAARAAGPCARAVTPAEQMVCSDPELAAADRELNRAYRRALAAGAAPYALRSEQRDWLAIREDAARRSRRAVANIYDQRIDELNAMADDRRDPGDDDDGPDD